MVSHTLVFLWECLIKVTNMLAFIAMIYFGTVIMSRLWMKVVIDELGFITKAIIYVMESCGLKLAQW